jgi:hypothetical protein
MFSNNIYFEMSEFMINLQKQLKDEKDLADSTIKLYIKYYVMLNNKQLFNNLSFLKDIEKIDEILKTYKPNTHKTILSSIVTLLSLFKDKPTYKKLYKTYYDKMMTMATDMKQNTNQNEKTETQKDNWIKWEEVQETKQKLLHEVQSFLNNKIITSDQYNVLLSYLILSLYTGSIAPRRNQDYLLVDFIAHYKDDMNTDKNYLDWANKEFIFNQYKTKSKYGQQKIKIDTTDGSEPLEAIKMYLKHHPLNNYKNLKFPKNQTVQFKFLVYPDGKSLDAINSITRILNKIFNKKIGSSMLRHIYLSNKYNIDDMKNDSKQMAHGLNQQRDYIKTDTP